MAQERPDGSLHPALQFFVQHQHHRLTCDLSLDPAAFSGPSVDIRRLLSLALVSKEMRALVYAEALPALAERLVAFSWRVLGFADPQGATCRVFRKLSRDPDSCSRAELRAAAADCQLQTFGSKKELIPILRDAMILTGPRSVPPELLLAVEWEKGQECPPRSDMSRVLLLAATDSP